MKLESKVDWSALSFNKNAIHILEKNLDKVNWYVIYQEIKMLYTFLKKMKSKVNWLYGYQEIKMLYTSLEKNLDKVSWYFLST